MVVLVAQALCEDSARTNGFSRSRLSEISNIHLPGGVVFHSYLVAPPLVYHVVPYIIHSLAPPLVVPTL